MEFILFGLYKLRQYHALAIPTPVILCIAAVLGSVSSLIALNRFHNAYGGETTATAEFIIIIPAHAQQRKPLKLPSIRSVNATQ